MTWLAPIGFLGLIGVLMLIIIYIIKPNYQQKVISSTYIWNLSLKFRKRRLPISRLHNLILFLCQLLILTILGSLLAGPVISGESREEYEERILIIDASASMMMADGDTTRFDRAVDLAIGDAESVFAGGGRVSVILAGTEPEFIAQRATASSADEVIADMRALSADNRCTYASADLEGAVAMVETVLYENEEAKTYLYTGTEFIDKSGINVVDVSGDDDWNAAVHSVTAKMDSDNHYRIYADVGCYGRTDELTIRFEIHNPNGRDGYVTLTHKEFFDPSSEKCSVEINPYDLIKEHIYSYTTISCYIDFVDLQDSLYRDNFFILYGGEKPTIRIQYASSLPNSYFGGVIRTMRQQMRETWSIDFTDLAKGETPATEGYDFYVFEHFLPEKLPTDGLVLLVDPIGGLSSSGIIFGGYQSVEATSTLAGGEEHPLTSYVDFSRITIAKYTEVLVMEGYRELAYYQGRPVMMVKEDESSKVVVWNFDLNYSNLPAMPDFPFLMYNMFNYFIPATVDSNSYDIGDVVKITARGENMFIVSDGGLNESYEEGYTELTVTEPGTYTVYQTLPGTGLQATQFFVSISEYESNITKTVDALPLADVDPPVRIEMVDLILYFAIALVCLLFAEWWLYNRKNY